MINITSSVLKNSTIILGFSGGPDSTCLLTLLALLQQSHNLKIIAAHLDHQWRIESGQDLIWCKEFVAKLSSNIIFESARASDFAQDIKYNGSKEEFGRKIRRKFFQFLAQKYQADSIMLAHHQNDQLETFFIRMIRGTSLTGITCMKMHDGLYQRPLLNVSKQRILQFLQKNNINFLNDQTNYDLHFLRNKIRHTVIESLQTIDARFAQNSLNLINHLQKTNDFLDQITEEHLTKITLTNDKYDTNLFLTLHPILQHRILIQLLIKAQVHYTPSQNLLNEIMRFLSQKSSNNTHQFNKQHNIEKEANCFSIKSL